MTERMVCGVLFILACLAFVPLLAEGVIGGVLAFAWMLLACAWSVKLQIARNHRNRRGPHR